MRSRLLANLAALAASAAIAVAAAAADAPQPPSLRLPEGARPTRYALTLTVVPGEAKAPGEIVIDVELVRPHAVLWLNADTLAVTRADAGAAGTRVQVLAGNEQFVGLAFDPPLPAGTHRLTLAFEAEQSRNSTRGIFALQEGGAWYAMTQFEPASARRAFPCFDEPGYKVPWRLTLRVPQAMAALANTPAVEEAAAADGMKVVRFAETRPLPSYLVAFAVGPFESVDLGRLGARPTPTRIVVPRGRLADAEFAARAYPELFDLTERWFGTAHPYPKLDHVAIPLAVGFAMENAGLITYGAPTLLARPGAATPRFRRGAATVGAHEIAHQWFGNLVTAAWWDDIWLNEAFATWFAEKIVDQWQPAYEGGAARVRARAAAIAADGLGAARRIREPIGSRSDIANAFDSITYQKGATVIGMFEGWVGAEPLQRGVRRYLDARRDGNATVRDFLDALTAASGRPVASAFSTFLDQNGVPQVSVALACTGDAAELALTQRRHTPLGAPAIADQRWQIPVCVRYGGAGTPREACTLLTAPAATLPLEGGCPDFVFANAGGRGYYVPEYRGDLLAKLAARRDALTPAEYASVLYDLRALLRAGAVDPAAALGWASAGAASGNRHVQAAAIELAVFVRDTLVADADRARYAAYVRSVFGPRAKALGFIPRAGESDDEELLRRSLLGFAAPEDPELAAEARRLALAWTRDRTAVDPGLVDTVLLVATRGGDAALFDALLAAARATPDGLDRRNLLVALLAFGDPALARRGLELLLDPGFDIREAGTALWISRQATPPRRAAHDFVVANFDAYAKRVSRDSPGSWPTYATGLCTAQDRQEVEAFWRDRAGNYAGGTRNLAQALESIELCARLRAAQGPAVAAFLANY
jgi:alanyl aminopeptidase